jgi:hypothetical protein
MVDWKSWQLADVSAIIPTYKAGEGRCASVYLRRRGTAQTRIGGAAPAAAEPVTVPLSPATLLRRLLERRGYAYKHAKRTAGGQNRLYAPLLADGEVWLIVRTTKPVATRDPAHGYIALAEVAAVGDGPLPAAPGDAGRAESPAGVGTRSCAWIKLRSGVVIQTTLQLQTLHAYLGRAAMVLRQEQWAREKERGDPARDRGALPDGPVVACRDGRTTVAFVDEEDPIALLVRRGGGGRRAQMTIEGQAIVIRIGESYYLDVGTVHELIARECAKAEARRRRDG